MPDTKVPTSWTDLNKSELVTAAEFFGTDAEGTKEQILASLAEDGVSWELYAQKFLAPAEYTEEEPAKDDLEETTKEENMTDPSTLVTRPQFEAAQANAKYLVKMERDNPYFEWRRYKFTQERPFAVMPAQDAQTILTTEEGFRQAYPSEVDEFYS